jgi:hydrogenase nickel incorporation protein HypA/HybF
MHEYSLMEGVVENILDRLKTEGITTPGRVREVKLRIGALDIHSEESFAQAFKMLVAKTVLDGSKLSLEILPGRARCGSCNFEQPIGIGDADGHDPMPAITCPRCGGMALVTGGRGMEPIDLEIDD